MTQAWLSYLWRRQAVRGSVLIRFSLSCNWSGQCNFGDWKVFGSGRGGGTQTNYMAFPAAVRCGSVITRQSCDCLDTLTRHNNRKNTQRSYRKEIGKGQPRFEGLLVL